MFESKKFIRDLRSFAVVISKLNVILRVPRRDRSTTLGPQLSRDLIMSSTPLSVCSITNRAPVAPLACEKQPSPFINPTIQESINC